MGFPDLPTPAVLVSSVAARRDRERSEQAPGILSRAAMYSSAAQARHHTSGR